MYWSGGKCKIGVEERNWTVSKGREKDTKERKGWSLCKGSDVNLVHYRMRV